MASREKTFIGYRPLGPRSEPRPFSSEDLTDLVESGESSLDIEVRYTSGSSARAVVLSQTMIDILKQKLRAAEERESLTTERLVSA